MLSRKIQAYRTKGCKLAFHHLLYADDMLVFSNGHKNSIRRLLKVINGFCDASGQMLNPEKSKVYFSSHINEERRKALLDITYFSEGNFPVNYLGAPLFAGRARVSYFKHLEDVVRSKISSWAKNFLFMSGRATLISSVLGSMSIHTLSILPVPKVVIQGIERLMRNFLWDRGGSAKHHWVRWEQICMPKDEGRLGIRKLSDVKKCLLNKLAWRFLQNQSIWAKFPRKKYLHKSYSSAIWSSLKPYIHKMCQDSCWEIGKGDILLTHFCEWLNVKLPKQAESWTIKDVVNSDTIKDSLSSMLSGITPNIIDSFQLSNSPDRLCWKEGASGTSSIFSTKASYDKIKKSMPKKIQN
ncbi:hypothetical protein QQ045_024931 [Rhodiola kirilowii]